MTTFAEPNRIPVEPIVRVIQTYLQEQGTRLTDGTFVAASIHPLAERVDIRPDTLDSWLSGGTATIDFDIADRLLCAINRNDLWLTELHDVYQSAMLPEGQRHFVVASATGTKRCEGRGCFNTFSTIKTNGGKDRRFCSERCRQREARHRKKLREGKPPRFSNHNDKCLHGHEWTDENTYWHGTPKRRKCRACVLIRNEAARQRRRDEAKSP